MRLVAVLCRSFGGALAVLVAVLLTASAARATVVSIPTMDEMAVASDVIAEVVVGDARVVYEEGRIITYTALDVRDGWKGAKAGDKLELFQVGGTLDGRTAWIAGAHRFAKGERLVFFGMRFRDGKNVIPYGIGFGLFGVTEDVTGTKVRELVGDVVALAPGPDGKPVAAAPGVRSYDTLAAFKSAVLRMLELKELPQLPKKQRIIQKPGKIAPASPAKGG